MSIQSTYYSSELTSDSQNYSRTGCWTLEYYYEAIEINVSETGGYSIISNSTMNTYGYIYENNFDVFNLTKNLIAEDDESGCDDHQFKLTKQLRVETRYILIVTTFDPNRFETFSVVVIGPKNVSFNRISE